MSEAASPSCFLARYSGQPCDGKMDKAHLLPKSYIKRELKARGIPPAFHDRITWHPAVWVWACRRHHSTFDTPGVNELRIPREDLPSALIDYCREFDFLPRLDRMYPCGS